MIREKRIFRDLFGNIDTKENPMAIPDYLEKHFAEKEKAKKQRKMMGEDYGTNLKDKIAEMEEKASMETKKINVREFKEKKK